MPPASQRKSCVGAVLEFFFLALGCAPFERRVSARNSRSNIHTVSSLAVERKLAAGNDFLRASKGVARRVSATKRGASVSQCVGRNNLHLPERRLRADGHASCVVGCMTKTDDQLKRDIETELSWDPKVHAAEIGVSVNEGAVSLLGTVDTYAQKWAAEDATKRVAGVRTVAQDLTVKIQNEHKRSDTDIAEAIQSALKWDVLVPKEVTAKVNNGMVTLEGQVPWHFQRESAERALRNLPGVISIFNSITIKIKPETSVAQVKEKVEAALQRQAKADAKSIRVDLSGGKVTLTGYASSWQSIEDAANAAWAAPGVTEVLDQVKMQMTI